MTKPTAAASAAGLPEALRADAFHIIGKMEDPLETIRALLSALAMMAEAMDDSDEGEIVQRLT